ncbi:hypothetical protein HN371_08655 [Candidatus Poribacteria bacterium]|jgi:hypothetical protein|nr:hypothetical protein [Candidatus Poribacteria bacterium]MBT7098052.1 hypothetical protein [Candidatus Poribacteria bacterium]
MKSLAAIQVRPDTKIREDAREMIREWDNHPPCPECEETGMPVVDGGGVTSVGTDDCDACGRQTPRKWKRRHRRAAAKAGEVEIVTRRKRG